MKDIGKLMEKIEAVDIGGYALCFSEFIAVYEAAGGGMSAALTLFNYGFLKGQRAERARAKKAK